MNRSLILIVLLLIFVGLAAILARDMLVVVVGIILGATAAAVVLSLAIFVRSLAIDAAERIRIARARRIEAESAANTTIITARPGEQVFVRELRPGGHWRNLHLDPRLGPGNGGLISQEELARWLLYQQLHAPRVAAGPGGEPVVPLLAQPMVDIRQAIHNLPAAIVVGSMDSGKTTLLHWIVDEFKNRAQILVLDPHSAPEKWPGARVVGGGRKFAEIEQTLDGLLQLMNRRYQEIGDGLVREGEHQPVVVVADEWMAINEQCASADKIMVELLTESRKAALRFYIGSHSRRVRSLGLDRKGDLLDGVAFLLLRRVGDERRATIETYDGEETHRIEAILPGEYHLLGPAPESAGIGPADSEDQVGGDLDTALAAGPEGEELQILSLHRSGASYREISQAIWGDGKYGDFYNRKIEATLAKWAGWQPPEPPRRNFRTNR